MSKESLLSVMDLPKFEPWTTENWFDEKGQFHSRELFLTWIRLKQGTIDQFTDTLLYKSSSKETHSLKFYSPEGEQMTAEIRGFLPSEPTDDSFDHIGLLVALSKDQVLALFPCDSGTDLFGY